MRLLTIEEKNAHTVNHYFFYKSGEEAKAREIVQRNLLPKALKLICKEYTGKEIDQTIKIIRNYTRLNTTTSLIIRKLYITGKERKPIDLRKKIIEDLKKHIPLSVLGEPLWK